MSKKNSFKLKIKGIDWTVYLQSDSAYSRSHGTDSSAIMSPEDNEIFFKKSKIRPYLVRHELFHAYISSCNTNSSNLTPDQIEELCVEVYGDHGPEMALQCDQILNFLLKKDS